MSERKKTVFIVTPGLHIINKVIPEEEYNRPEAFLTRVGMGIFLTIIHWNGWSHFTKYGAFVTREQAKDFVNSVKELREEAEEEGETRPAFEPDWGPIFPLIEKVVKENDVLYIEFSEEEWTRLNSGGLKDIIKKYKLSEEVAEMLTLQSPEYPEKHYQLAVCHHCTHHC